MRPDETTGAETDRAARDWRATRCVDDFSPYVAEARAVFSEIRELREFNGPALRSILRRHPRGGRVLYSKNLLVRIYQHLCEEGSIQPDDELLRRIRMKPTRTISGVAPVTVLTKPYPCPGRCVFCPTDARMPKSYLPGEPGAQRAEQHGFDPHEQVSARIRALATNGHPVDKIELLILGGTWSSYPREYQEWFVRRCLEAMNGREAASLEEAQEQNEEARHRNVGLVIETRPDHVTPEEIRRLRELGVTKVQLGAQSLDDEILERNHRGHDVEATRAAMTALRSAGFKLVLHWMPNLLGSTPERDRLDFSRLWSDEALRPDEIKIYPCSLLENAELFEVWKRGEFTPYSDETLVSLVAACKGEVPAYCRINRVFRDIPSTDIVAGSHMSNLREAALRELARTGGRCRCIRCREVRDLRVSTQALTLRSLRYRTRSSREEFLSFETEDGLLAGYARLSLPSAAPILPELAGAALIREVHVYGPALDLGSQGRDEAQHRGLGTRLLEEAEAIAHREGYRRMAVIASVGTRPYYAARGYRRDQTYVVKELGEAPAGAGEKAGEGDRIDRQRRP
jgi:elongator complex protein 3